MVKGKQTSTVPLRLVVAGITAFLIGSIWTIVTDDIVALTVGIGSALAMLEIAALWRRAHGFTATIFPVLIVNTILISGLVLWPVVAPDAIVAAQIEVDTQDLINAAQYGMTFSAAFTIGALIVGMRKKGSHGWSAFADVKLRTGLLVFISYVGIGLAFIAYGSALIRGSYLGGTGPEIAVIASNNLTPAFALLACIAAFRPGHAKVYAIIAVALWSLILFGRASRTLAAMPSLLLIGWLLSTKKPVRWWHVAWVAVATVFLLQLPLFLRGNADGVGILTLGETFLADPEGVLSRFSLGGIFGNVLFSAPLTGVVGGMELPPEALWISLSPALGDAAGWPDVSPYLRINQNTPYAAIGELAAYGGFALTLVPLVIGAVFAFAERVTSALPGLLANAGLLIVMGLSALYSVSVLQYNLRSSARLVWYLLALVIFLWIVATFFYHRRPRSTRFPRRDVPARWTTAPGRR